MGSYSRKIKFERAIIAKINSIITSHKLIGLSENAIEQWWKEVQKENSVGIYDEIILLAKTYGFVKDESNSLREFPYEEQAIQTIVVNLEIKIKSFATFNKRVHQSGLLS